MKVTPMTAEETKAAEAAARGLWPKAIYDFEVATAIEKVSTKGNDMTELAVTVFDKNGNTKTVRDWLVESPGAAYKIRHFAESVGMLDQYSKGDLPAADLPGKTGRCELFIKKDKKGLYADQNAISDYLPPGKGPLIASKAPEDMDDEIPF